MKRYLPTITLLALAFGLNAAESTNLPAPNMPDGPSVTEIVPQTSDASPSEVAKPDQNAEQTMKSKFWHKVREHKAKLFQDALTAAGVDAATSEKVTASLKEMTADKNKEFKELKVKWHADLLNRLKTAGLTDEKVGEVLSKYQELKKAAMMKFFQQKNGEQSQKPDAENLRNSGL